MNFRAARRKAPKVTADTHATTSIGSETPDAMKA